ncbi:POU domain, class 6, transcription factor 2 isoform X1 [Hermetia illucens]|uniref:POU domain, class 6, transcription factor 2 isoform X1 n=1 Tax=Hermetia illucens TaxID=343691 RepID=UPI0018CC184B|nr:POU domain, class 6, transcription factor 2 isoform X1 [Hermetia illucens]
MAEGAEETESNNNADTPAMLGTVLPCEALQASIGGMKREFDSIGIRTSPSQSPSLHQILTAAATITTAATTPSSTISTAATLRSSTTKSPSPSPSSSSSSSSSSGNVQQHPINLKSEEYDKDSCHRVCSPGSPLPHSEVEKESKNPSEYYKHMACSNPERNSHSPQDQAKAAAVAAAVAAQAHLNGTMQDMINLQKLQNLASIQHQQQQQQQQQQQHQQPQQQQQQQQREQQHTSVGPGALAGLQGLAGISSAAALNSPLNLSVGSTSTLSSTSTKPSPTLTPTPTCSALGSNGSGISACSIPGGSQMPQLILASGQLVQGVQGAQLLIPTSQGIAVQTILTIPVSQQISTNDQFLQSYAALSSGATTAFSSAAALGTPQIPLAQPPGHFYKPNLFSSGVQQLLAALHPQLFPMTHADPMHQPPLHHTPEPQPQQSAGHSLHPLHPQQQPSHQHHPLERISPKLESLSHHREPSPQHLSRKSPLVATHPGHSPPRSSNFAAIHLPPHPAAGQEKPSTTSAASPSTNHFIAASSSASSSSTLSGSQLQHTHSPNSHSHNLSSSSHSLSSHVNSPSSAASVLNSINSTNSLLYHRLTTSNGELTITKSHAPASHSSISAATASSTSPSPGPPTSTHHSSSHQQSHLQSQQPASAQHQQQQSSQPLAMKLSPSSMHLSPTGTEVSATDLLVDSPNEPTINQTNCNVVDGIDLDEIKEFAKAFKLRRLSLGLTQTQVGQALSVTEGPAYSQSAICSALAAQMYAAQLSSQQQNMFEKLDITPKSAQKIKPVLERWMKEAEESHWNRYKTGQNHLTDFIGIEPSKKRKRRTSFTPQALELLNAHFERNTHPSGTEITGLAHQLGYEREVIRIWFCNKRQALKNTVRMMSKGMV